MAYKTICPLCSEKFDRDKVEGIKYKNRWYHAECINNSDISDTNELKEYICKLFSTEYVSPVNMRLINKFKEQGFTAKQIYQSLFYFFEIKKNPLEKAGGRIGIVPFAYEDAKQYFEAKERGDEKRAKIAIERPDTERTVLMSQIASQPKRTLRKEFDISDE